MEGRHGARARGQGRRIKEASKAERAAWQVDKWETKGISPGRVQVAVGFHTGESSSIGTF